MNETVQSVVFCIRLLSLSVVASRTRPCRRVGAVRRVSRFASPSARSRVLGLCRFIVIANKLPWTLSAFLRVSVCPRPSRGDAQSWQVTWVVSLWEAARLFPKGTILVQVPVHVYENSGCSTMSLTLAVVRLFTFCLKLYLVCSGVSL